MKKCKHCQSEIEDKAKVCPNCRKKQGMPTWLIVILVIFGIIIISSIISGDSDSSNNPTGTTTKEKISLLDGHSGRVDGSYSYEITGTLQNNTDQDYSYVSVEFYVYDSEGNLLDTCLDNNSGMEANGKWKFTASCFFTDGNAKKVSSYKLKEITQW